MTAIWTSNQWNLSWKQKRAKNDLDTANIVFQKRICLDRASLSHSHHSQLLWHRDAILLSPMRVRHNSVLLWKHIRSFKYPKQLSNCRSNSFLYPSFLLKRPRCPQTLPKNAWLRRTNKAADGICSTSVCQHETGIIQSVNDSGDTKRRKWLLTGFWFQTTDIK